jgi:hypothetical protein
VEEQLVSYIDLHNISEVRQMEVHTAEPLVPDLRSHEVEVVVKLGKYRLQSGSIWV